MIPIYHLISENQTTLKGYFAIFGTSSNGELDIWECIRTPALEEDTNNKQQMETFLSHFPLTKANKLKLPEVETDYCIIDTNF